MTNPNDPWAQRPEDAPTEHIGPPGNSGFDQPSHTTEYTEAYGQGADATSVYPATEQFGTWSPPPPNATREFPPYESQPYGSQWGSYGEPWSGTPARDATHGAYGPPGAPVPPGGPMPPDQQPPKRSTGLWIALGLGVILLIGAVGVVAGVLLGDKDSSSTSSASTSAFPTPGRASPSTPRSGQPNPSEVIPPIPGLGDIDGLGATMGTITANTSGTLTLSTLGGSATTVRTTESTQVISLSGSTVADLPVGDMVVVQGDKAPDGSIDAKIIISTALPGGPR